MFIINNNKIKNPAHYVALLSQEGLNNPTINVMPDNNLPFELVFNQYEEKGVFSFNIPATWDLNKLLIDIGSTNNGYGAGVGINLNLSAISQRLVIIETYSEALFKNGILKNTPIYIGLYK